MNELRPAPECHLYERVTAILDEGRSRVLRTVNTAMAHAYLRISDHRDSAARILVTAKIGAS